MTDDRLLTRLEVAEFLGVPPTTIANWASRGDGPPFMKIGRHVRYSPAALEKWLSSREIVSTPQPHQAGLAAVQPVRRRATGSR